MAQVVTNREMVLVPHFSLERRIRANDVMHGAKSTDLVKIDEDEAIPGTNINAGRGERHACHGTGESEWGGAALCGDSLNV